MADGSISQITLPNGSVYDIKDTTSGFITGMTILSYGSSTYADALAAYQSNKVVYCRASSNSNPSSGNQLRLAFLAYVNNQTKPTEFEFQYYRSVNTHSNSQQGDQVYVYKLNSAGTWSVTVREAYTKMVAGTGLSSSYSNGILTTALADAYGDTKNPYGTKTANYVLAGPTSGSATKPSFRALVAADIPDLSGTYLTSYTETDPTVPAWAKAASKPTYTALEVGALASNTTYVSTVTTTAGAHSAITSQSGTVSFNVPTKTSHLTNDSGFLTSAPVTSVNGSTGAVTVTVPTKTSELTNDGDGTSGFVTGTDVTDLVNLSLLTPTFCATDATAQAVLRQAFGALADVVVPSDITSTPLLLRKLEPRTWFAWMNGTEMEFARMSVSANTSNSAITLYLRGRTSIATGIMGVDSSWTISPLATDAEGVAARIVRW